MTLPVTWIRKNMLDSPGPSHQDRPPTEAEIKVQRSLQKLSIPEWYLNSSSRPPKILANDTPIESRPPVWKEKSLNKSTNSNTSISSTESSTTVNRNGLLETEFGPPPDKSYGTYKINRSSLTQKSPVAKKRTLASKMNHVPEKKSSGSRILNISRTFPRVSPSRKIQNINIVFPQTPKVSLSNTITIDDEDSHMDMTKDSLDVSDAPKIIAENLEASSLADASLMSNSSEQKVSRMPNQQLTYIKPWKSPVPSVTPEEKVSNGQSYEMLATSTPKETPVSAITKSTVDAISTKEKNPAAVSFSPSSETPKIINKPPMVPRRILKSIVHEDDNMCDACKADLIRRSATSFPNRRLSGFGHVSLCPIDETAPTTPKHRLILSPTSNSPTLVFFMTKKKSSQLQNIVKRKDPRHGKSLVQAIIEELNEKCRISAQPTYVTRGSKNFVKKLVRALEKGALPRTLEDEQEEMSYDHLYEYPKEEGESEEVESSGNGSEDEVKSAAVSTSISFKDSDSNNSSDSELRSPTTQQNYNYDWNMNIENQVDETAPPESETKVVDKEEESVYWIPVTKSKLPRSSSLVSMISRLSTNSPGRQSPSVSPIRQKIDAKRSQTYTWGMTYRTSDYGRPLRRIDETTVLDSGYSDRSRGHSSESSDDNTWFDDTETTQTASENGSYTSFSLGTYRRRSRAQISGRRFVI